MKASVSKTSKVKPVAILEIAEMLRVVPPSRLKTEHLKIVADKLSKGNKLSKEQVSNFVSILKYKKLSDDALSLIHRRLSTASQHLGKFVDNINERIKAGESINDALKMIGKGDDTVLDAMAKGGKNFHQMLLPDKQNREVYRYFEPKMVDLIEGKSISIAGKDGTTEVLRLDQSTIDQIKAIFDKAPRLKGTERIGDVNRDLVKQINKVLGESLDIEQIRLLNKAKTPGVASKGSVFEHWTGKNIETKDLIPTIEKDLSVSLTRGNPANFDSKSLLDFHYYQGKNLVAVECKNISGKFAGHQVTQLDNYKELIKQGKLTRVDYVFVDEAVARKNAKLIDEYLEDNGRVLYLNTITQDGRQVTKLEELQKI